MPSNNPNAEIEHLTRRLRVSEAVRQALMEIAEVGQFHARLQRIADVARGLTNAQFAALAVFDQQGEVQEFFTSGISSEVRHQIGAFPSGRGMFATLFREGRSLRLASVRDYPLSSGFPPHHPKIEAFRGVPIRRAERLLGAFDVANRQSAAAFSDEDREILENFAAHVAFKIDLNPWARW